MNSKRISGRHIFKVQGITINVQKMTVLQFSRVNFPQDKTFYKVEAIKHRDNVCIEILSCSPYTMLTINLSTLVIFTQTVSGCLHCDMSNCSIFFLFSLNSYTVSSTIIRRVDRSLKLKLS